MPLQQRNKVIDSLRGYAILLVVIGHSVQYNLTADFDNNILFRIIYSFHMPLFMFISGYVAFGSFDGSFKKLMKRGRTLLLPFFAWFLIGYLIKLLTALYDHSPQPDLVQMLLLLCKKPDIGLWFLWVLFLNYVLLYLACRISAKYHCWVLIGICIALNLGFKAIPFRDYFGIGLLKWYSIFFSTAYILGKYRSSLPSLKWYMGLMAIVVYVLLMPYYNRVGNPIFYTHIAAMPNMFSQLLINLYNAVLAFSAIAFSYYAIQQFIVSGVPPINKFLNYIGGISLEIYATHFHSLFIIPFLVHISPWLAITITAIWAFLFSWVLQSAIKKVPPLSLVLYGKTGK